MGAQHETSLKLGCGCGPHQEQPGVHSTYIRAQRATDSSACQDCASAAATYKALDTRLDRTVTIKVLFPDVSADPNRRAFPCASAAMRSKSGGRGRVARSFAWPRSFVDQGRSGSRNDSCGSGEQTMLGALTLLVEHDSCHVGQLALLRKLLPVVGDEVHVNQRARLVRVARTSRALPRTRLHRSRSRYAPHRSRRERTVRAAMMRMAATCAKLAW